MTHRPLLTRLAAVLIITWMSGCETPYSISKDYSGPRAVIKDTAVERTPQSGKAEVFRVLRINGAVDNNTPMATPYGGGPMVTLRDSRREVVAGQPLTLTLRGGDEYAADIVALSDALAKTQSVTVTGNVSLTPRQGVVYAVNGTATPTFSSVWIEEEQTSRVVTPRVSASK